MAKQNFPHAGISGSSIIMSNSVHLKLLDLSKEAIASGASIMIVSYAPDFVSLLAIATA